MNIRLREYHITTSIPAILLSDDDQENNILTKLDAGPTDYIVNSFCSVGSKARIDSGLINQTFEQMIGLFECSQ